MVKWKGSVRFEAVCVEKLALFKKEDYKFRCFKARFQILPSRLVSSHYKYYNINNNKNQFPLINSGNITERAVCFLFYFSCLKTIFSPQSNTTCPTSGKSINQTNGAYGHKKLQRPGPAPLTDTAGPWRSARMYVTSALKQSLSRFHYLPAPLKLTISTPLN